jgi:phospholipase/lecithinase/hemolysin
VDVIGQIRSLYPDVVIYALDAHKLFDEMLAGDYPGYSFLNVSDEASQNPFLASADTYLFWDDIHPTEQAHQILGDEAFNLINGYSAYDGAPVPEPATLSLLALGGVALLRRRMRR